MSWWGELFGSDAWQAVQLGWEAVEDTEDQADRIMRALQLSPGDRVVDVPCGTGRIALALQERGVDVVGVDGEPRFIEAGHRRAAEHGRDADLRVGDMREPLGVEGMDAALCFWGSFGYFDREGDLAQARAAAGALRPGGRYLVDTVSAEVLLPRFRPRDWFEVGEVLVLTENAYVEGTGRVECDWTFLRGAERTTRHTSVRVYSLHELTELLREAGFSSFEARDDGLEPFELGSERLWLVATKEA